MKEDFESEKLVTSYMKLMSHKYNCLYFKLSLRYFSGFPDCLIIKNGKVFFIELKKTGGKATRLQECIGRRIKNYGGNWICLNSKKSIKKFFEDNF